jgi:hypothetical protein
MVACIPVTRNNYARCAFGVRSEVVYEFCDRQHKGEAFTWEVRPELWRAILKIEKNWHFVVVDELHLSEDPSMLSVIKERINMKGGRLAVVNELDPVFESGHDEFIHNVTAAVLQLRKLADREIGRAARMTGEGKPTNAYGATALEQRRIKRMLDMWNDGLNQAEIATAMNTAKLLDRKGVRWTPRRVEAVLRLRKPRQDGPELWRLPPVD